MLSALLRWAKPTVIYCDTLLCVYSVSITTGCTYFKYEVHASSTVSSGVLAYNNYTHWVDLLSCNVKWKPPYTEVLLVKNGQELQEQAIGSVEK